LRAYFLNYSRETPVSCFSPCRFSSGPPRSVFFCRACAISNPITGNGHGLVLHQVRSPLHQLPFALPSNHPLSDWTFHCSLPWHINRLFFSFLGVLREIRLLSGLCWQGIRLTRGGFFRLSLDPGMEEFSPSPPPIFFSPLHGPGPPGIGS